MTSCPKCGSSRIAGPTYMPPEAFELLSNWKGKLRYICVQCGYVTYQRTLDDRDDQAEGGKAQ